ncbi:hypothetical protein BH09PAT2_BH09PAT2_11210 [soil metagenome]
MRIIFLAIIVFIVSFASIRYLLNTEERTHAQNAPTIVVDPNSRFQTITGWEGTDQSGQAECSFNPTTHRYDAQIFNKYKDTLYTKAVNDLGLTRVRLEARSSIENPTDYWQQFLDGTITEDQTKTYRYQIINDDNDPNHINPAGFNFTFIDLSTDSVILPMRQKLQARGEKLYINLTYVDFGSSSFEHTSNPAEYGEYMLAIFQHMQSKYGFTPDAIEVILEPDNTTNWTGTNIGKAIVAAGDRLKAAGFTPEFIAPATTNMTSSITYFDQILAVPGTKNYLKEFAYHRYQGVSDQSLQTIAARAKQNGINTAMTEHIASGYQDLHADLKMGNNSAWQQFTIGFCGVQDDGGSYFMIDQSNINAPQVVMSSYSKFLSQYFRYIRPGAVRIASTSSNGVFDPVSFINKDGKYVVVVKATGSGNFNIGGLPAGTYGLTYTTGSQYNVALTDVSIGAGEPLSALIPASGVITIYGKTSSGTIPTNTPTSVPTAIPTNTISPTTTPTVTVTPFPTVIISHVPTISLTPSVSLSPTHQPSPTLTSLISPTLTPTIQPGSNCLKKNIGDADCASDPHGHAVTILDYAIWYSEFIKECSNSNLAACGSDVDKNGSAMDANFNYPGTNYILNDTKVDSFDYAIWIQGFVTNN